MNPASINSTVPVETMIGTALILLVALRKVILNSLRRLSKSRLTLETESFDLTLQTKQHSSQQELPLLEQGGNDDGTSNDDNGRISGTGERPKW
jgi:hypothetical protein